MIMPDSSLPYATAESVSVKENVWIFLTGDPASVEEICCFLGSIIHNPEGCI